MSGNWYDINWKMRRPVAVNVLGGGGGPGTFDIQINIPKDWDDFWENVNVNMFDVVPVNVDGLLLPFKRAAGANYADRILTLELDAVAIINSDSIAFLYVYWMNTGASDQATSPTITSAKDGYIFLGQPTGRVVQALPNRAATEAPQTSFTKTTNEAVDVWFNIGSILMQRKSTYKLRKGYEAINYVQVRSLAADGSDDANRYDEAETRFIPGWVKVRSKAGSNNTDYTLECLVFTSATQIISLRCLIKVRDLLPA